MYQTQLGLYEDRTGASSHLAEFAALDAGTPLAPRIAMGRRHATVTDLGIGDPDRTTLFQWTRRRGSEALAHPRLVRRSATLSVAGANDFNDTQKIRIG